MRFFRKLYRNIVYKKHGLPMHQKTVYKQLMVSQYYNAKEIKNLQEKAINTLCETLITAPYYKSYDINNDNISLDDFLKQPQISKNTVKKHKNQMFTKSFTDKNIHSTSGSTGYPLVVYLSGMAEVYRHASAMRFLSWWGCTVTDKNVYIWGRKNIHTNVTILSKLKSFLRGRLDINVFDLSEETIHYYYNKIEKYNPKYIRGYKSALFQLAELMDKYNLSFKKAQLKVAIVTSEVLYDSERMFMEKIFLCPLANEYGASDGGGIIAMECPQGGMHINEESVLLDVDAENNIILTELFNDNMPLVNYQFGDKSVLSAEKCVCGRGLRIIDHIEGRENEYIIKPNGQKLSQYVFYYIFGDLKDVGFKNAIIKYKVYQEHNEFKILIQPGLDYSDKVGQFIIDKMHKKIGIDISIEIKLVESIPRDKSGKLRFFVRIN